MGILPKRWKRKTSEKKEEYENSQLESNNLFVTGVKREKEKGERGTIEIVTFEVLGQSFFELKPIEDELENGNIALINLRNFLSRVEEERERMRLLDKLRGIAKKVGGSIAQINRTGYLLITPKNVVIRKNEEKEIASS
ncbi:MAG: cell division protein SepF [Candidatus Asgardarchaeia archaeon]